MTVEAPHNGGDLLTRRQVVDEVRRRRGEALQAIHRTPLKDDDDERPVYERMEAVARLDGRVSAFTECLRLLGVSE